MDEPWRSEYSRLRGGQTPTWSERRLAETIVCNRHVVPAWNCPLPSPGRVQWLPLLLSPGPTMRRPDLHVDERAFSACVSSPNHASSKLPPVPSCLRFPALPNLILVLILKGSSLRFVSCSDFEPGLCRHSARRPPDSRSPVCRTCLTWVRRNRSSKPGVCL